MQTMPPSVSAEQFAALAQQGYNRIPLIRTILADMDTPLSAYVKLAKGAYSYVFESVQGGEKWGRYSIIGLPAQEVVKVEGHQVTLQRQGVCVESVEVDDPLTWIAAYQARFNAPEIEGLPRFTGGLVGYFGYDTVRYIEPHLAQTAHPDPIGTPDILMMLSEELIVFDNLSGKLYLIHYVDPTLTDIYTKTQQKLDTRVAQLRAPLPDSTLAEKSSQTTQEADFVSGFTQSGYQDAVKKAKQYILDGDIMQVVLSQRMSIPFKENPLDVYRALRCLNPSPYMYFLDLDDFHIVGSSPEILTRKAQQEIVVRPIAGTRPRGQTEAEDLALEQDLLADPKELAEHLMLIDLGRNDIGRVAEIGSVKLTDKMIVERYSHVMHIVSNVVGTLKPDLDALDLLRASFPAGTLSGAPKIRAMEIIDELEPVKRGIYGGAIGYLAWNGDMDVAIAIRTAVIKDKVLHVQAGAGIVADSVPEKEWEETMNKARAVFRAVEMAEAGLS